ncbi:hypothetical protein RRG08_020199 [Elysia crispata]|uniref:Uncharacterized protein n=1 Tax=Elysia crispata TaxID=231223 RepID=A0AAE1A248_9GAST|nr:hypothetical protein RRG08_020199 [Elysia crispata]
MLRRLLKQRVTPCDLVCSVCRSPVCLCQATRPAVAPDVTHCLTRHAPRDSDQGLSLFLTLWAPDGGLTTSSLPYLLA